jgi:hypothetical protein
MRAHEERILHIAIDHETHLVATATKSEIRIWSINQFGRRLALLPVLLHSYRCAPGRLDPRGRLAFSEGLPQGIRSVGFGKSYIHATDATCTAL